MVALLERDLQRLLMVGWTKAFIDWFKTFIPSLPDKRPILLLLDGHSSHVSYEVQKLAIENNITMLITLNSHSPTIRRQHLQIIES